MQRRQSGDLDPAQAWEIAKRKLAKWAVITIDPLLLVAHLTLIYIVFLIADDLVLAQIERSFGDLINQSRFTEELLKGTKVFAALGTATAYGLHIIYSLYLQARHVAEAFSESEEEQNALEY